MKFCEICGSRLEASTLHGDLKFICKCKEVYNATPEDSLRVEISYESAEIIDKYEVLEENSAYDTAGKKIMLPCPKCNFPYMTHIYIGTNIVSKYVCRCGYKVLTKDYKNSK